MISHILISIGFYFVLVYLSVNLLGFLVRGLFSNLGLDRLEKEGSDFIKEQVKKSKNADKWINVLALILFIAYFYLILHFWNIGVMLVVIMIMAGRLPDLIWEIKHGRRITSLNIKLLPHDFLFYITSFLPWAELPILYYSL